MAKAKKTKEITEKLTFTIIELNKDSGIFTYLDEDGEEKEGVIISIFNDIKLPFDVTLKSSDKEDLDVQFISDDEIE